MTLSLWNLWWSSGISLFFLSFFSSIFYKFLSSCQDILLSLTELGCWCGVVLSAMIARRLLQMERPSLTFINGMFLLYFTIDAVMGALETFFSFRLFRERWWQHYLDILIFSCTFFPLNNAGDFKRLRGKKPRHTQCNTNFQFSHYQSIFLLCSELGGAEEAHVHNCMVFCSVWALWNPHRMLFHLAILFTRQLLLNILNKAGHFTGLDSCMFDTRPVSWRREPVFFTLEWQHLSFSFQSKQGQKDQ